MGEVEVAVKVEPLHDDVGPAGPEGGDAPADADVPHRVDAEVDVVGGDPEDVPFGVHCRDPVSVGEHGAFRLSGGPGGVLDLAEVVEPAVGGTAARFGTEEVNPGDCARGIPADGDDVPECWGPVADAADEGGTLDVGDDGGGSCVADGVEDLVLPVDPVRRDRDGADPPEGKVGDEVLRRTVEIDADPLPAPDPEGEEAACGPGDQVEEVGAGIGLPPGGDDESGFCGVTGVGVEKRGAVRHGGAPCYRVAL
ncbi:hypothetical protein DSECCO2_664410 [anaerobic digester metagenome]